MTLNGLDLIDMNPALFRASPVDDCIMIHPTIVTKYIDVYFYRQPVKNMLSVQKGNTAE